MGVNLRVEGISYLICATQRSGSTLSCELLRATDVAGVPDEYFEGLRETGLPRQPRQYFEDPSVRDIAERLTPMEPGRPEQAGEFEQWFRYVLQRGTTFNGVFGSKMMWNYLDDFKLRMAELPGLDDLLFNEQLKAVFPRLKIIFISRRDKVAQAVSLWKAIQTSSGVPNQNRIPRRSIPASSRMSSTTTGPLSTCSTNCTGGTPIGKTGSTPRAGTRYASSTTSSPSAGPPPSVASWTLSASTRPNPKARSRCSARPTTSRRTGSLVSALTARVVSASDAPRILVNQRGRGGVSQRVGGLSQRIRRAEKAPESRPTSRVRRVPSGPAP